MSTTAKELKVNDVLVEEDEGKLGRNNERACQTETWSEQHFIKYRKMKRKLVEMIAKKKEYQAALDKAHRKIQGLEKKSRQQLQQKRTSIKKTDDMDTSTVEDEMEDIEGGMLDEEEDEEEDQLDEDDEIVPTPKKQRLSKRKRVLIPRDEDGAIILPFQIASLNVIDLGTIDSERPGYHNDRYIFPIGYTVERTYMSMVDPNNQTTYTCKVEDGQDGPLFTLCAADAPQIELSAKTATGVWASVIKRANEVRQKESSNAISGPEYYGFAHPLVIEMMEEMPGVDACSRYRRKHKA